MKMAEWLLPMPLLSHKDIYRFWSKTEVVGECQLWRARTGEKGYGVFRIAGRNYTAHRIAYWNVNLLDPGEFLVCHWCNVRHCVKPDHLYLGTNSDNQLKCELDGRRFKSGSSGSRSKFWDSDIPVIKKLTETNSQSAVARMYGVVPSVIRNIVNGATYAG